jgi:hypothetical protein
VPLEREQKSALVARLCAWKPKQKLWAHTSGIRHWFLGGNREPKSRAYRLLVAKQRPCVGTSTQPKKIEQEGQDGGRKDSNRNSRREDQTEHEKNDLGHQKLKHNSDLERPTKEINEQHKNVRQQLISVLKSNKIHTNNRSHRPSTLI